MKKKRIIAGLLCIMMVLTMIPMMTMAAVDADMYNLLGPLMGATSSRPVENDATWFGMNFDFTDNFAETAGITKPEDITYDNTNGLTFPKGTAATWKYFPDGSTQWSPLVLGGYYMRVKVDEGGMVEAQACKLYSHNRSFVIIKPTGITVFEDKTDTTEDANDFKVVSNLIDYQPGTDWNDVAIVTDGDGYSVYMKKETDAAFTKIATATSYRPNGGWKTTGLTLSGNDSYVSDAVMLQTSDTEALDPIYYNSVEEIVGGSYATTYNLELDKNFAENMEVSATEGVHQKGDDAGTVSGTYSKDGWSGYQWKFLPYSGWEVFSDTTFLTFTAKTSDYFNLQTRGIGGNQLYIDFKSTGANYYRDANATVHATVAPGSDWAEYLIKKSSATSGYEVYIKQDAATGGKWQHIATTANFRTATNGVGITITPGANAEKCCIKNVRVHTTDVVSDVASKPATATRLTYRDDFTSTPTDGILAGSGVSFADGNLVLTKGDGDAEGSWSNLEVPVGGYAEFRLNAGATCPTITFCDGNGTVGIYNRVSYGVIYDSGSGIAMNFGDGGDTYRTWRVVRNTKTTYSLYSKSDSDTAWAKVAENITAKSVSESKHIFFSGSKTYAGDEGVAKIDYLNIYGPKIEYEVVITDGKGNIVDGSNTSYSLDSLTATIQSDAENKGIFFFAVYGENGNLIHVVKEEIPVGTATTTVECKPLEYSENIRKIKAFIWNGTDNIVPVTDMIEIKGNHYSLEDVWTLGGKAFVDGNTIVLDSVSNAESFAEFETVIDSQFDISWDMIVDQFGGEETAEIYTGSNRVCLDIEKDGIAYKTSSGTVKLPWIVGNGSHTYRVIGNGNSASLYMDDFFVGNLTNLESSAEGSKIRFWNKGESSMEIFDVSVEKYSADNIPAKGFHDEFNNGELCGWSADPTSFTVNGSTFTKQWVNSKNGYLFVEDYHLAQSPNTCVTSSAKTIPDAGDDFVLQTEIRFPSYGTESYIVVNSGGRCISLDIREKYFSTKATKGYSHSISDEFLLGTTDHHIITIETYNRKKNARIYLDGVLVQDTETAVTTDMQDQIFFQANGGWYEPAQMQVEYVKFAPKYYNLSITSPGDNAIYNVGDTVQLSASENTTFKVNGIRVATGESTSLTSLPAGHYEVVAESGNKVSETIQFVVKEKASTTLGVTQNGTEITASLGSISGFENVASVSYFLDGKEVGNVKTAPYPVTISGISPENHMIEAVAYNAAGICIGRFSKEMPAQISGNITNAYSNEISYTVTSEGTAEVKNGTHRFYMIHKSSGITYATASGIKSYQHGTGTFKVFTDGPYAEVYRNGQYVFGFRMPKNTEMGTSFSNGITDGSVTVPTERKSYFSARNLNVQNEVYELADLPYNHNLDFVASPEDEVHLTLNDGYYRNDISIKGGTIYVWDAPRNNSVAQQKQVATMSSGEVYYRIETSAGMSRLYADGKWIYTFRNGQVSGQKGILAVNVTSGDGLAYLGVNSNQDLYYYTDTFNQSGEFLSTDYWMTCNGLTATQKDEDLLLTSTAQNGIAELSSSVGNASLTAHMTVYSGTQGFWFVANHGVTDAYTKVGYNFTTGKYEIVDVVSGNVVNSKTATGSLATGKRVLMNLKIEESATGKSLALYVDGNKVISSDSYFANRGRIGFMVANGKASLGYVVYRGDAKPVLDVRDNPIVDGATTLDMIEAPDKTYLFNSMGGAYTTTDGGKTWEKFTVSAGNGLSTSTGVGVTENMVALKNGEILSMVQVAPPSWRDEYGQRKMYIRPYYSSDYGMNWNHVGTQGFPGSTEEDTQQGRGATVNAVTQGPSGRVYFVLGGGNSEDYGFSEVWMSDNNGRTWFKSMTPIDALRTGYVIAEAKVIETSQNTRFYFRTDKGEICYYESYDFGETWDMIPHPTPFIASMTCFSIEADPSDPDTLYIGWGYDNVNLYARPQFPRTRWAVAKSIDAGDTWEMLGTVHENNSIEHNMMNLNINVAQDYVYLNAFSSDTHGKTLPWTSRIVAFPKNLQRTTPRLEQLHTMYPSQIENTLVLPKEQENLTLTVHPTSGNVTLRGQLIRGAVSGDYVAMDVVAAFLGAAFEEVEGGSIALKIGNGSVEIPSKSIKTVGGKAYGKLSVVADKLNLTVTDEDGTKVVGTKAVWSTRQKNALRYATDVFALLP